MESINNYHDNLAYGTTSGDVLDPVAMKKLDDGMDWIKSLLNDDSFAYTGKASATEAKTLASLELSKEQSKVLVDLEILKLETSDVKWVANKGWVLSSDSSTDMNSVVTFKLKAKSVDYSISLAKTFQGNAMVYLKACIAKW